MALVYCPECGTKISDRAISCPYCGYRNSDPNLPMTTSAQPPQHMSWGGDALTSAFGEVFPISEIQKNNLNEIFGKAENLMQVAPAFFETLKSLIPKTIKVAQINDEIQKLIDSGVYRFITDKSGEILPSIYGKSGLVAQVRLKDLNLTPKLGPSIIDLQSQIAMAQVLGEIHEVRQEIANLHGELQDDRLALADSAWQQLQQAAQISDTRVREAKLLNVLSSATDARNILTRAFISEKQFFDERVDQGRMKEFADKLAQKSGAAKSNEIFNSLLAITKTVQVEASGYSLLGEQQAAKQSIRQFSEFIEENKLNNRDTLLLFNSYSDTDLGNLVDGFSNIQQKIAALPLMNDEPQRLIDDNTSDGGTTDGQVL